MFNSLHTYAGRAIKHLRAEAAKLEREGHLIHASQHLQAATECERVALTVNIAGPNKRLPGKRVIKKYHKAAREAVKEPGEIPADKQAAAIAALERGDIHTALALRHGF